MSRKNFDIFCDLLPKDLFKDHSTPSPLKQMWHEYFLELHINCRARDSKESLKDFKCNLSGFETTEYCIDSKQKANKETK